jgi:outer membrane protein OmpA-like peptidoglycan-associated protein
MSRQSHQSPVKIARYVVLLTTVQMLSACLPFPTTQPQSSSEARSPVPLTQSTTSHPELTTSPSTPGATVDTASVPTPIHSPSFVNVTSSSSPSLSMSNSSNRAASPNSTLQSNGSSLRGNVSDVESALQDLGAETVGDEIQINLPADVLFNFDQATIRSDAAVALTKLLTIINARSSNGTIHIAGHTDAIGDVLYNQQLSERRAIAVKSWLEDEGIAATRLQTQGFGESNPIAANTKPDGSDDPIGRQKNRRVQIVISTAS